MSGPRASAIAAVAAVLVGTPPLSGLRAVAAADAGATVEAAAWSVASGAGLGYEITDPAAYNPQLRAETITDRQRSSRDCWCGTSRHSQMWVNFYTQLHEGLRADPGFTGPWVHELCGVAYPVIFRVVSVDPNDDSFAMHSDCSAGVMAMTVVCAQSSALHRLQGLAAVVDAGSRRQSSRDGRRHWRHTPRVVLEEGASVGDIFQPVPLKECLTRCEDTPGCLSVAFGPFGCHLKTRCVHDGDPMVPQGEQGDDYQTYYLEPCSDAAASDAAAAALLGDAAAAPGRGGVRPSGGATASEAKGEEQPARNTHVEEVLNMMSMGLRVLEFCYHCLDASPWPFLLAEVLENYALAVEAPKDFRWQRAAGRLLTPSTRPGPVTAVGLQDAAAAAELPSLDPPAAAAAPVLGALPPARLTLLRLQVRWTRGLEMEAEFWRKKLSPDPDFNDRLPRLETWMATGEVTWFLDGDDPCEWLAASRAAQSAPGAGGPRGRGPPPPRLLNVGSGPFAPGPQRCSLLGAAGSGSEAVTMPVVAADGLARYYNRILDEHGLSPPHSPVQCPVEELHNCFPPGHFDVVHMRNALDHVFDPLLGIQRMLHVVRPGGWVFLRHARNEGIAGSFRNGLHQWAFDTIECPESSARSEAGGCVPSFLLWNPELRLDVTSELLASGVAQEVRTERRDHPSDDAPEDEFYVWVDIRKPTDAELGRRLAAAGDLARAGAAVAA